MTSTLWKLRGRALLAVLVLAAVLAALNPLGVSSAQIAPPPPNIGTDIPQSYFGPMPSQTLHQDANNLVGPVQLLRSGPLSDDATTIELPLYRGQLRTGEPVWYVLTDTTDEQNALGLGLNFASKLSFAAVGDAVRTARLEDDATLTFDAGRVDFSPERRVVPGSGPNAFPPAVAEPGSVGDADYTPLVRIVNQAGTPVYNAPVVAFGVEADQLDFCDGNPDYSLVHDRVAAICATGGDDGEVTVTMRTTPIFSFGRPSVYLSTEASDPVVATLDNGTFAPAIGTVPVGGDDSAFSAVERLFVTANGPTGADNPQRQGLNSALTDDLPPVHVVGGLPTIALDYSPLWDLNLGEWTQEAIDRGYRARVIDEFQYLDLVEKGWITGPGGTPFGSTGIVVNCPIVARLL